MGKRPASISGSTPSITTRQRARLVQVLGFMQVLNGDSPSTADARSDATGPQAERTAPVAPPKAGTAPTGPGLPPGRGSHRPPLTGPGGGSGGPGHVAPDEPSREGCCGS